MKRSRFWSSAPHARAAAFSHIIPRTPLRCLSNQTTVHGGRSSRSIRRSDANTLPRVIQKATHRGLGDDGGSSKSTPHPDDRRRHDHQASDSSTSLRYGIYLHEELCHQSVCMVPHVQRGARQRLEVSHVRCLRPWTRASPMPQTCRGQVFFLVPCADTLTCWMCDT